VKRVKSPNQAEEKGKRGLANAIKLNDDTVRFDFEDGQSVTIKASKETLPEYMPFASFVVNKEYPVSVTLNKEENKALFVNPARGEFEGTFEKFNAPEGQEPAPETKMSKKGNKPYKTFGALLVVEKGKWKGCKYFLAMYPNFGADEDGLLGVSGQGSGSDMLYDFLQATGVDKHQITYSENPLPEIQQIAQQEKQTFRFVVNKGYVETIIPPFIAEDEFAEEDVPAALRDE